MLYQSFTTDRGNRICPRMRISEPGSQRTGPWGGRAGEEVGLRGQARGLG